MGEIFEICGKFLFGIRNGQAYSIFIALHFIFLSSNAIVLASDTIV
jgi:hypothetical protein